jgi:hypothetical protein
MNIQVFWNVIPCWPVTTLASNTWKNLQGQAVQETSEVTWLFFILYIFFDVTMLMLFHKILVVYMSSFLTFFHWYIVFFLWSPSVKCPLFLLWIYGNHNWVTHFRNFMKCNPYFIFKASRHFATLVYKIYATHNCNERKAEQSHTWKKIPGNYEWLEFLKEVVR